MSLGYKIFDDIENYLTERTNLDERTLFYLLSPISFYKRQHLRPSFPSLTSFFLLLLFFLFQIGEFDLVQEATPIVNEDLLEAVTLAAKSCEATAQLSIDKDIDIVRRVTSPPIVGDVTTSLHESPTRN